jgi:hypothetical protein
LIIIVLIKMSANREQFNTTASSILFGTAYDTLNTEQVKAIGYVWDKNARLPCEIEEFKIPIQMLFGDKPIKHDNPFWGGSMTFGEFVNAMGVPPELLSNPLILADLHEEHKTLESVKSQLAIARKQIELEAVKGFRHIKQKSHHPHVEGIIIPPCSEILFESNLALGVGYDYVSDKNRPYGPIYMTPPTTTNQSLVELRQLGKKQPKSKNYYNTRRN